MDDLLGTLGKWHWPTMILNAYMAVPHAWFVMAPSFMEPIRLEFWCAPPQNVTLDDWKKQQNEDDDLSCFANYAGNRTKCTQWHFNTSGEITRPMQLDFRTVCDNAVLVSVHQSLLMGGLMVGNFIFSHLSDWFGRRPLLGVCVIFQIIFNALLLFAPNFGWVLAFTFAAACGYGGLQNIPFTLAIECVGPSQRALVSTCEEVGWILGLCLFPICTYLLRDWRYLQLALIPPLLITAVLWCFCDESPRWLVANGRTDAAKVLLTRIGRMNGIDDTETKVNKVFDRDSQDLVKGKCSVVDLFRNWHIAKIAVSFYIQFAVSILLYFSLIFFIVDVGESPHVNLLVSALLELPLIPIAYVTLKKLKRKTLYFSAHLPSLLATLALAFLPKGSPVIIQVALASIGKWASQILFSLLVVHVAECFPTEVRALAVGSSMTMSRIGAIIAPFMKQLDVRWSGSICATAVVIAYASSIVLPETSNSTLPETFHETRCKMKQKNAKEEENAL